MRILVADDDKDIVDLLTIYLKNEGYNVVESFNGKETLELVENADKEFDLVILDVVMPEMTGLEVVKEMRSKGISSPVIMVSAKSADHEKIEGLLAGADDYVTKPFNPLEVMARVKSILRRQYNYSVMEAQSDMIQVGPLIIRKDSHEVRTKCGELIQLTALEFGILFLLASHPNQVFSAEEIFEDVWNQESIVSAKTVMVHVSHLRDKIAEATGGNKVVQTVWGVGYKVEK